MYEVGTETQLRCLCVRSTLAKIASVVFNYARSLEQNLVEA